MRKRKFHRSCVGLPLSPGYKKQRSRPSKWCVLRSDIAELMNFSRVADVDSIVVNLRADGEGRVARSSLWRTMTSCKVPWSLSP